VFINFIYNLYSYALKKRCLGVIGAGLMGAGIANVTVDKGIETVLIDVNQEALDRGLKQIATQMEGAVKRKKYSVAERATFLTKLNSSIDYTPLKKADVVIEAVFEDLNLKHQIIQKVDTFYRIIKLMFPLD
jgi:enoyl-CoA hydratase/long-chain 3-hydroxyacyl-CoA dehydrogenase